MKYIWNRDKSFFSLVITNLSGSVISFFSSFLFIFSLFFCSYYLVLIFLLFQCSTRNWCTLNLALIVSKCGNTFELLPGFNLRIYLNWNYLSLEKKVHQIDEMIKCQKRIFTKSNCPSGSVLEPLKWNLVNIVVYCWLIWHKTQRTVSDNFPLLQFKCCNVPEN